MLQNQLFFVKNQTNLVSNNLIKIVPFDVLLITTRRSKQCLKTWMDFLDIVTRDVFLSEC